MTINKLTLPAKDNAIPSKVNDIIDELGNKLENTATGLFSITIDGTATDKRESLNIGYSSIAPSNQATVYGCYSSAGRYGIALGCEASATDDAIQLGKGTNNTAHSFNIGFYNGNTPANYALLDGTTGLIPDARISTNIARTSQIPSISNLADKDLGNLSATGQAVIDGKADTSFSNITNTAKIAIAHNAMPSNTYTDLTLGASGSTYTAPADGYYDLRKAGNAGQFGRMGSTLETGASLGSNEILSLFLPVRKGDEMTLRYSLTGTTYTFRFVYALGSESEAS